MEERGKANIMNQRANGSMNPFHIDTAIFHLQLQLFFLQALLGKPYESAINFRFSQSPSYPVSNDSVMTTAQSDHDQVRYELYHLFKLEKSEVYQAQESSVRSNQSFVQARECKDILPSLALRTGHMVMAGAGDAEGGAMTLSMKMLLWGHDVEK